MQKNEMDNTGLSELGLNDQLNLLKSILESSTEYSIIAADLEGIIVAWSSGAKRLHGYEAAEVIGKNVTILHRPEDVKKGLTQRIIKLTRERGAWSGNMYRVRKDGTVYTALVTVTLRKDAHNNPVGFTSVSRDISELNNALLHLNKLEATEKLLRMENKALEDAARISREATTLKNTFLANVSHELRTPLNGILGFATLLLDGIVNANQPEFKDFLRHIITSANQLLALINEVLDLAKIEAGKMQFHLEEIDMPTLLNEVLSNVNYQILQKKIELIIDIDPSLQKISLDPVKLKQVIYNYLSNAIKFTTENGKITIHITAEENDKLKIAVSDTGIGIAQEDLNKLFVEFQQLDSSSTKTYQGTGLGLALTKRIVEAQDGRVGVISELGKGSTFFAVLPLHFSLNDTKPNPTENSTLTHKTPSIFVIEQEKNNLALITNALEQAGYSTVATKALKDDRKVDAIVIDLFNFDFHQWKELRKWRTTKIVECAPPLIITALIEQPKTLGFKINDFLLKPIQKDDLLTALKWQGFAPHTAKTILIIDNDPGTLKLANNVLVAAGFKLIHKKDLINALISLEQDKPDMIILDPFMHDMDGFEFLRKHSLNKDGKSIPILIWTQEKFTPNAITQLKMALLKNEDMQKNMLDELLKYLPPLKGQ